MDRGDPGRATPGIVAHRGRAGEAYHRRMLLAIDVGNTNLRLGTVRDGSLAATRRAATPATATPDEVEVLEGVDVEADGDGGEVRGGFGLVDHDPFDPAGAVRDKVAAAEVAVRDRLLDEGPEQVEHVRPGRHDAAVDVEPGGRRAGHGSTSCAGRHGRAGLTAFGLGR